MHRNFKHFVLKRKGDIDMGFKTKRLNSLILSVAICFTMVLGGCASGEKIEPGKEASSAEEDVSGEAASSGEENVAVEGVSSEEEGTPKGNNVGEFSMQDIEGETYTQEMFADYDLTLVNIFTTWCSPCINEIPDLQKLREEMKDQGVNVVGIALDTIGSSGSADEETVEVAKKLAEYTGASYPFLIPDEGYLNGRLTGINAVPETFFVDKEGNIVGETYSGSRSLEEWKEIVQTELKGVAQ